MKRIVLFFFILSCSSSFAFEYNVDMISYQGGVISQLNNCGVHYSSTGRYLWGFQPFTTSLQSDSKVIKSLYNVSAGVLSVTDNNEVYFSHDAKNLSGGGETRYLGKYANAAAYGSTIYLISTRLIRGTRGAKDKTITKFTMYHNPGQASERQEVIEVTREDNSTFEVVGHGLNRVYLREVLRAGASAFAPGNAVKRYSDFPKLSSARNINDLKASNSYYKVHHAVEKSRLSKFYSFKIDNPTVAKRLEDVKKVLPYNGGIISYGQKWVVSSSNYSQVLDGSSASTLYNGTKAIASLLPRGGDFGNAGQSKGLLVSFTDGYSYWSKNGANLTGGSRTIEIIEPLNPVNIKSQLTSYLNNDRSYALLQNYEVSIDNLNVKIVNRGGSAEFSKNFFIGSGGSAYSAVTAIASSLYAEPSVIRVYDKGWSGFEYKWRDRGLRTGLVEHETDGNILGDLGIKLKAENECSIIVGLETIAADIKPFEFTWDLNPDGSLTSRNFGGGSDTNYGYWNDYAIGEPDFTDFYPESLLQRIILASFKAGSILRDGYGKPLSGTPVSVMKGEDPSLTELGGLNLNAVCKRQTGDNSAYVVLNGERLEPYAAYHWKCVSNGVQSGIDMDRACDNTYPGRGAFAEANNLHDAYSWKCYQ